MLREQLGQRRLRCNGDQRRPSTATAKGLGSKLLWRGAYGCHARDAAGLASPTDRAEIGWHWQTGMRPTEKIGGDRGSGGAPGERKPQLGISANQGALGNLGHKVGRGTIAEMLARHGMEPGTRAGAKDHLKEFLTQHWDLILATQYVAAHGEEFQNDHKRPEVLNAVVL